MEREKATTAADLPHEFKPSAKAPVICVVCQHAKHNELHNPSERASSGSEETLPREIGT